MRLMHLVSAALLAGVLALPLAAGDHPCPAGKDKGACPEKGRGMCMLDNMNLSQDQKEKLKAEREQGREGRKAIFAKVREVRELAKAELLKPQPSKNILDGYAQQLADLHKKMMLLEYEHLLRVKAILTPAQFEQLLKCEQQRMEGYRGMHGKSGEGCKKGGPGCRTGDGPPPAEPL